MVGLVGMALAQRRLAKAVLARLERPTAPFKSDLALVAQRIEQPPPKR